MPQTPKPMQRLVMLTAMLRAAGPAGRPALELANAVGFQGTDESRREQLARQIRGLQSIGVQITNESDRGEEARWVLQPGDSRIRLAFTPAEQSELARAALLADRDSLKRELGAATAPAAIDVAVPALPVDVDQVLRAIATRAELRFRYNGKPRQFDAATLQRGGAGWAVSGIDRGSGEYRTFYLTRMTGVAVGDPGSAREVSAGERPTTDPLTWPLDPPITARLTVAAGYEGDVRHLLGEPADTTDDHWAYPVTNRWLFLARIAELGERVVLVGPDELRTEFADRLRAVLA